MANKTNSQRLAEIRNKKKEEENKSSSSSSASRTYRNSEKLEKRRMERNINLDTFESDLSEMGKTISNIYSVWQDQDTLKNTKTSVEAMQKRINDYQNYQSKFGSDNGFDISDIASGYQSVLDNWDNLSSTYGYYQNADAYNTAMKKFQMDTDFAGLTFDEVQSKLKEYDPESDEYKYLSTYTGYTNLNDYDKAIEALKNANKHSVNTLQADKQIQQLNDKFMTEPKHFMNDKQIAKTPLMQDKLSEFEKIAKGSNVQTPKVANGSAIAYTGVVSESDKYLKELETKRNQYELDHAFDRYSHYMDAEDFAEKSQYVSTIEDSEFLWMDSRKIGDETYEYINNYDGKIRGDILYNHSKYQSNAPIYTPSKYEEKALHMMNDDEKAVYNYLHRIDEEQGTNKANEFLEDMEVTLTKRATDIRTASFEEATDDSVLASVALSLASIPMNVGGAIYGAVETVGSLGKDEEYNPYSIYNSQTNYSSAIRENVGENIADATEGMEIFGQNIPSFLYQTGMSIGDSALGAVSLGKTYTPLMGTNAFQQKVKELTEAGEDQETILKTALASGLAETVFEYVSIDHLINMKNVDGVKSFITGTIEQMGIEGSEEIATELANIISDSLMRGESSELAQMYQDLKARGYSEEEANTEIAKQIGSQVAWAGIGGSLSGEVMGAGASANNYSNLKSTGSQIRSNDRVGDMWDFSAMTPQESEAYKLYESYAKKGINADNISNAQLGNLYATAEAEAIETLDNKKSTDVQKRNAVTTLKGLKVASTVKESKVTSSGETVKINGIKTVDGDTVIVTNDGEVSAKDVTFSANDAEIISYAENMSEEKASVLLKQYDGQKDVKEFVDSFEMAYTYGEIGFGADSVLKHKGVLTEAQASEIYKAGMMNRSNVEQKAIEEINAKHSKNNIVAGNFDDSIIDYNNATTDATKVNWRSLTKTQQEAITFAKGFSEATGVNIKFVKSEVVDGKHVGKNGSYKPSTNTIEIDVYAGRIDANSMTDSIIPTMSHELTHWMKAKSPAMYSQMREYVMNTLASSGQYTSEVRVGAEMARMEEKHPDMEVNADMAIDELIARACEDMLSNSNTARKLLNRLSTKDKSSFVEKVKKTFENLMEWVNELLSKYKSTSKEAEVLREYKKRLKELSKMWDKALAEAVQTNQSLQAEGITGEQAINAVMEKMGIAVDMNTMSASPAEQFSERTWTESEYVQNREKAIAQLVKALGVSKEQAGQYIDDINSIARLIADDRVRLDYEPNIDENATVVKPNSEYKYSVDMSTLCAKRLLFTGTFDAIQRLLPNTAMDSDDIVKLRAMMKEADYEVACGICYVESTRREIGTITADFIERYKEAQKTGKPITRINSSGKAVDLQEAGTKAKFYAEKDYTPTLADLNTTDIDMVKRDHPSVYGAYLTFMNARGQAKPKLLETRAEYKGEILKHFNSKSAVNARNNAGGLRLQSFSDFEVPHLIDMMQIVMDMSRVGLKSQAYTKVVDFAEAFGDTGVKINLSLIAKDSGLDADENLIFDDVEGINHEDAFRLRDKYSKNVGTILVGKNDAHIIKAMSDPRIDYIIPFHKSSWKESLYDALGLTGYDDYTSSQNEKSIDPNRKIKNFDPSEYWDFTKTGEENAQIYLAKCKEDGRIPKFPQFQGYEGYWKLLIDFKMYDNDGVGSPQTVVKPSFNMEESNRILNGYKGGHRSFPVAKDVVEKFVAEYKESHPQEQYADREVRTLTNEDYEKAKSHFGTTTNPNVAGYLLKDGKMLDFSGKHWGNPVADTRDVDHRDIWDVWESDELDGTDEMVNMISNGNIRLMPETGGINLAVAPNAEQRKTLEKYINHFKGEVIVDIDRIGGDTEQSFEYDRGTSAKKIFDDIDNYFNGGRQSDLMRFHTQYSDRVTDHRTLEFLNEQIDNGEYATVYRSFQIIDGGLYAPMNAVDRDENGKNKRLGYRSELGQWEMATESPEIAQRYMDTHPDAPYAKFDLDGVDNKTNAVAYNPYLHASNMVLNDQFSGAYRRKLVTVECRVPLSEIGAYRAKYAKDATGWADWKAGTVAGKLMKVKPEYTRKLFISRYMLPVRIVPDSEVAQMYKEYLDGTDISVPWNVVTPSLREELEKIGVKVSYNDVKFGTKVVGFKDVFGNQYSDREIDPIKKVEGAVESASNSTKDSVQPESGGSQEQFSDRDNVSVYEVVGEDGRLASENAKLREDIANLKSTISNEEISIRRFRSLADYLKKLAGSQYNREILGDELQEIYTFIQTTDNLQWNDVMAKAYDVANRMMNIKEDVTPNYFKSVLQDIRTDRVSLSVSQKGEAVKLFGNYADFHKMMFGRVSIVNEGTPLSEMWKVWSQKYPSVFDANLSETEQVKGLVDIIDALKTTSSVMGEYEREEAIRHIATEVYNQFWNIASDSSEETKKLRSSHRQLMEELRKSYEERQKQNTLHPTGETALKYEQLLRKVKEKDAKEMARIKKLSKDRMDNYKDRLAKNAKIQNITKKSLTLNQWLLKNSKDEHIPEIMKEPVAYLLGAIDFSSKQLLGMQGGNRAYTPTKKDISLSKALEKVHDMVQNIDSTQVGEDEITEIYGTFADFPAGFADDIRKLSGDVNDIMRKVGDNAYVLNDMSLEQLEELDMIISIIKATVTKMNKFLAIRHAEGVAHLSQQSINYMDSLGEGKVYGKTKGAHTLLDWGNAMPYFTFKRFGQGGQMVYEAMQDGWDKFAFHVKAIIDYAENTYTSKEVKEWENDIKDFKVLEPATEEEMAQKDYEPKYQNIQMTIPQIMSLYCLQKREQAKNHLMGGGIRITDITAKKGVVSHVIAQTEGVILSESELDRIVNSLTDRQREVADALQRFMNTTCSDWGNEVSMLRFGIKQFGEENYFPIQSDKNNLAVNDETEQNNSLFRLLNMSFTKGLTEKANNRVVISDIFDVFAQHASDMAKYNALALPVLDAFKWYNYKEKRQKGETQFKTKSLKQSLENAFGKDGQNYFVTFLRDINGEKNVGRDTLSNGFFTNAKIASVGFNLKVMALQPTSYVRASAVIDTKYLIQAFGRKPKVDMAEKYCGIALWKSLGFYDINVQRGVTDLIKHDESLKDKFVEKSMRGAEIADKVTWGYLWNACEAEVKDKQKALKVGSEEYYEAVAKRLREIIYSTQVVDSTMTRSQMMRSSDGRDKMLTAFASEPTLAYNMLQDCYFDWKLTARQTGSRKTAFHKHGKKMARVFYAYAITNALTALLEVGFEIFRDDEEDRDEEEILKMFLENFALNNSILNKIPYAKEAVSILQGFTSTRMDTQWMQYFSYTIKGVAKLLNGEGNAYTTAKNGWKGLSYLFGLPVYNAIRDITALLDKTHIADAEEMWNDTIGSIFPSLKSK